MVRFRTFFFTILVNPNLELIYMNFHYIRSILFLFLIQLFSQQVKSQNNLNLNWANTANSGILGGWTWAHEIAYDQSGNIYVTGTFTGTSDFDPSSGVANLTSAGDFDIYLAKYD